MRSMYAQADKTTKMGPVTPIDTAKAFFKFSSAASQAHFSKHQVNTEASNDVSGVAVLYLDYRFCWILSADRTNSHSRLPRG